MALPAHRRPLAAASASRRAGMERGSAAAPAQGEEGEKGEEREGCAGLWELPVERCERRPECGRCR